MIEPSRWGLGARITGLCLAAATLLTAIVLGAVVSANANGRQLNVVFNEIGPLRTDGEELLVALLNQETGIRGYAVNGSASDFSPYTDGRKQEQALVEDMNSRLHGRRKVAEELQIVEARMAVWRTDVAEPVIAKMRAGDTRGALALIDTDARHRFDDVRSAAGVLNSDILAVRNLAEARLQKSNRQIIWALITVTWIVIITGVLLALLIRRLVTNPVARLAVDVRQVAAGDYNHVVDRSGPPEVARLGRDVEEMRRRIVDDLRTVRAANERVEAANVQLERQAVDLLRSNQDLEQFAYVASHDLQEPLRKVASFCQLLQRRYAGRLDERADQYIAFAVDGAHRMQRLINDLLGFSRIGRAGSAYTDVDLNSVVAATASANEEATERSGGGVVWSDLPVVRGEEPLLLALFANLVSNSVKFRREGEPIRVEIDARLVGDEWRFTCRDHGIGIEAEYADKVFIIFQRLHARDAYPGTGIGLAVAKRIVDHHGGRIWIDTAVTDGTAVCFTLPAQVQPVQPVQPESAVEQATDMTVGER